MIAILAVDISVKVPTAQVQRHRAGTLPILRIALSLGFFSFLFNLFYSLQFLCLLNVTLLSILLKWQDSNSTTKRFLKQQPFTHGYGSFKTYQFLGYLALCSLPSKCCSSCLSANVLHCLQLVGSWAVRPVKDSRSRG